MESNPQNNIETYKNQIKSIIECLKSPMARPKALEYILGLCESEELTEIFISLELPKIMIRLLENEDIKEKDLVLQILINISGKENYVPLFWYRDNFFIIFKFFLKYIFQHIFCKNRWIYIIIWGLPSKHLPYNHTKRKNFSRCFIFPIVQNFGCHPMISPS